MDTGTIGPVTDMKDFKASFGGSGNSTIHGLIVSCILIPAALSSFFAGYVADRLDRGKGIFIGVFIFGVGAAIEAGAVTLSMFILGRIVEGLGEGLSLEIWLYSSVKYLLEYWAMLSLPRSCMDKTASIN